MLWLYWFGSFFLNYFTERKLTGVYLLGGLFGGLLYIAAYNIFPYFSEPQISPFPHPALRLTSWAIGSSASVMAIVFAVCTYLPQHKVYIFLLGPVKLVYLALFTALIDIMSISSGNAGGHIAHLGGALFGWIVYPLYKIFGMVGCYIVFALLFCAAFYWVMERVTGRRIAGEQNI